MPRRGHERDESRPAGSRPRRGRSCSATMNAAEQRDSGAERARSGARRGGCASGTSSRTTAATKGAATMTAEQAAGRSLSRDPQADDARRRRRPRRTRSPATLPVWILRSRRPATMVAQPIAVHHAVDHVAIEPTDGVGEDERAAVDSANSKKRSTSAGAREPPDRREKAEGSAGSAGANRRSTTRAASRPAHKRCRSIPDMPRWK